MLTNAPQSMIRYLCPEKLCEREAPMWNKIVSNRIEVLAEELINYLREPPQDIMEPAYVVVQSIGMRRYLEMEISRRLSICANVRFLLPQGFVDEIVRLSLKSGESADSMDMTGFVFSLFRILKKCINTEEFESIRRYLLPSKSSKMGVITRKEFVFADQLADLYQRYLTYRPEMIRDWDAGGEKNDWQAILWRGLREVYNGIHSAEMSLRFKENEVSKDNKDIKLASRIHIFGISSLPPLYLDIISRLAEYTDVNLYIFSPVMDLKKTDSKDEDIHPLLGSFGVLSLDFAKLLKDAEKKRPFKSNKRLYNDPVALVKDRSPTILEYIQGDILKGRVTESRYRVPSDDCSIRIHACHTGMRQVEVLRDEILHLLERDKELQPNDIVVMCPDIEQYAPLIEAVFKGESDTNPIIKDKSDKNSVIKDGRSEHTGIPYIPYSIADRAVSQENRFVRLITSLYGLISGRFKASELVEIFSLDVVKSKFGVTPEDVENIVRYITESGIRWGIDEGDRKNFLRIDSRGIDSDVRTVRFGLDRILLGLSLPETIVQGATDEGEGERTRYISYKEIFPTDAGGSVTSESLVKFIDVVSMIMEIEKRIRGEKKSDEDRRYERKFEEWVDLTCDIIKEFLPENDIEFEEEAQEVYRALREAVDVYKRTGPDRLWDIQAFSSFVEVCGSTYGGSGGLLRRGITFCRMVPLRNIPFKVVALLGMDDGAFPRKGLELEFDRIAKNRVAGDRNGRDDDLQLFLEAILSARNSLIITYTFVDQRSNKEMPPASPVAQLLDYINSHFYVVGDNPPSIKDLVVKRHPLHPFSPVYFSGDEPWSYHRVYCDAARKIADGNKGTQKRPFTKPLEIKEFPKVVTLSELEKFFINPQKEFLTYHGFSLPDESLAVKDEEVIEFGNLEKYNLKREIVEESLFEGDESKLCHRFIRQGFMPAGKMAELSYRVLKDDTSSLIEKLEEYIKGSSQHIRGEVNVRIEMNSFKGEVKVRGEVDLYDGNNIVWTASKLKAKHRIRAWLRHLWLMVFMEGNPIDFSGTKIIGYENSKVKEEEIKCNSEGDMRHILSVKDCMKYLSEIVGLYFTGLKFPLPLFCDSSYEFVANNKPWSTDFVPDSWNNSYGSIAESSKPEVIYTFGQCDTPYEIDVPDGFYNFVGISREFWEPYLSSLDNKKDRGEIDEKRRNSERKKDGSKKGSNKRK